MEFMRRYLLSNHCRSEQRAIGVRMGDDWERAAGAYFPVILFCPRSRTVARLLLGAMPDSRLRDLWAELEREFQSLRNQFPLSARGQAARAHFDEFLEFGLALKALCDSLVESQESKITPSLLAVISRLHAKMEVEENCLTLLRKKDGLPDELQ